MKLLTISISMFLFVFIIACSLQEPEQKSTTLSTVEQAATSRFMALGDNIISGYQCGGLTKKFQDYSFVAQIAKVGKTPDFQQPLLGYPGLGAESYSGYGILELQALDNPETPFTEIPDPVILPAAYTDYPDFNVFKPYYSDSIRNYPLPFSNLGIPGIFVEDILNATVSSGSASKSGMIDVILRNPGAGNFTAFQQAKFFRPSVIACWVGMYDVLSYAQSGKTGPFPEPTSVADFTTHYKALMDSLLTITSAVLVANLPDITDFPYFHVVPTVVIDTLTNTPYLNGNDSTVNLIGVNPTDLILMPAKYAIRQGYGIPVGILNGNGEPVPENFVLDAKEIAEIQEVIEGYNSAIAGICSGKIPVVDMSSFYKLLKTGVSIGGFVFSADYLTGNFFSLDGIHPSNIGNALVANIWINTLNIAYEVSIPPVDILKVMQDTQPDRY
jgi:hypothetical protein